MTNIESPILDLDEARLNTNYAGFWWRVLATLIDGILLATVLYIIGKIFEIQSDYPRSFYLNIPLGLVVNFYGKLDTWGMLAVVLFYCMYYALFESSSVQGTLGKQVLRLKVTSLSGEKISFGRAVGRFFMKYISAIAILYGYILIVFSEKKQALHDVIAGTLVIKKPEGAY